MPAMRKIKGCTVAFLFAAAALLPTRASAITVEVAKKCNELVAKEFPPRQIGNPAAGSSKGSGQAQREFFRKCVDNNGNIETSGDAGSAGEKKDAVGATEKK